MQVRLSGVGQTGEGKWVCTSVGIIRSSTLERCAESSVQPDARDIMDVDQVPLRIAVILDDVGLLELRHGSYSGSDAG
jgi:hypothetical protein